MSEPRQSLTSGKSMRDGRSRRNKSAHQTRDALLETGRQLLIEQGYGESVDIKLTAVLAVHGLSTGAGYHIWPRQADFRRDLALYLARSYGFATEGLPLDGLADIDTSVVEFGEAMRMFSTSYFASFVESEEFFIALRHWGVRTPSDELVSAINAGYSAVHDKVTALLELGLAVYRRRPADGYTIDQLSELTTALTEGFALRYRFADEPGRAGLVATFGHAYAALAEVVTDEVDGL